MGPIALLCYEAIGTSREAVLVVDAQLIDPDTAAAVVAARLEISVGRGGIEFDVSSAEPGRYELAAALIVDGNASDELVVVVPDLTLADAPPPTSCD